MIKHIKSTSNELVSLRLGQNTKYNQWKGPQPYRARTKDLESKNIHYLQAVFTTLWSIWNHRNRVTHEGKTPNPLEVILTVQSIICRYKEAFSNCAVTSHRSTDQKRCDQKIRGLWQLIIKIVGVKQKRLNRAGIAYEAKSMNEDTIMQRVSSYTVKPVLVTIQEAMLEATIKARNLGYTHFLFLSDSRRAVQVFNMECIPNWQEKILLTDWIHPSLKDCTYHSLFVPKFVNNHVNKLAKLATIMPIHSCMVNQNFL